MMNEIKNVIVAMAGVCLLSQPMSALYIENAEAGGLRRAVTDLKTTSLKVDGEVNAADLYFIGDSLKSLQSLDLSGASIVAYDGEALRLSTSHAARTIPQMAFAGSSLTSIILPGSERVTIADGAFAGSGLTGIDLNSADSVGMGAFSACASLREVSLPNSHVGANAFADCTALETATVGAAEKIADGMFARCTRLSTVAGGDALTSIGDGAFAGCTSLSSFDFGSGLKTIGARAFEFSGLQNVRLSQCTGLTSIGDRAFASCAKLADASIPESVGRLGAGVFFDDKEMLSVTLPDAIEELPDRVLTGASSLSGHLAIPSGVTRIGRFALKDVAAVDSLSLPAGLESLGDFAMENMTGLHTINAAELRQVPATGADVWRGVNQGDVTVYAVKDYIDAFRHADQWEKFRYDEVAGVVDVNPDGAEAPLHATFQGTDLLVWSEGEEIVRLTLYNTGGQLLVSIEPDESNVVVDTAGIDGKVFIVSVMLSDQRQASIKLVR